MTFETIYKLVSLPKKKGFPLRNEKLIRRFDAGEEMKAVRFLHKYKPKKQHETIVWLEESYRGQSLLITETKIKGWNEK